MTMIPTRRIAALRPIGMTLHAAGASAVAYLASARWVTLTSQLAHRLGMDRADAVMLAAMLGFCGLWLMLLWVFSRRGVLAAWAWLGALLAVPCLAGAASGASA